MDVVYERRCGLDIHKQTVVACVIVPGSGKLPHKEIRTFGTMTADLLELGDWLAEHGVTHVAMESTGVYWKATVEPAGGAGDAGAGDRQTHQAGTWSQDRVTPGQPSVPRCGRLARIPLSYWPKQPIALP